MIQLRCVSGHRIDPSTGVCVFGRHRPIPVDLSALRVGMIDIETSQLNADFGDLYSWCIKPLGKKPFGDKITFRDIEDYRRHGLKSPEIRILKKLVKALDGFDVLVHHYGRFFDIPYLRTRCLCLGIDFPKYGQLYSWDMWKVARMQLKLSSNRLDNVAEILGIREQKTHVSREMWRKAKWGNREAMDYIYAHNRRDVVVLEKVYRRLEGHWRKTRMSI